MATFSNKNIYEQNLFEQRTLRCFNYNGNSGKLKKKYLSFKIALKRLQIASLLMGRQSWLYP